MNIHDVPAHPALALAAIRLSLPDDASVSAIRAAIGDHIEALIDYLDAIEPDAELEETEEEQTLAWHESVDQSLIALAPIVPEDDELELDCDSIESDTLDEHGEEDRADAEPDLGWCNNVGQLRLDVGGNYGDGDSTAPERHGAGFIRCVPDDCEDSHDAEAVDEDGDDSDKEPSLGSVNPVPGIYALVMHMPRGSVWLAPPGIDQTNWSQGSTDDRELDAGDQGEPEDGC